MNRKKTKKLTKSGKDTREKNRLIFKKVACVAVICAIILSTLAVFYIQPWIVLVINACAIIVYRILFRKLQFSAIGGVLLYLLAGLLAAGVVALVVLNPDKIYGEVIQNLKDTELATFHERLNTSCWIFGIIYVLHGIWVIVDAVRTGDVLLPCHCVVPITIMGGLMVYIMTSLFVWLLYVVVVYIVNILCAVLSEEDGEEDWGGSGGSGGDTYDIIIIKH